MANVQLKESKKSGGLEIRYGKELDVRRLKQNVLRAPREHLAQIKKLMALFEDPAHLVAVTACCICGTKKGFREVLSVWNVHYVQCPDCRHVFLPKRLSKEATESFYANNQFYASTYADKEAALYRKEQVARPKIEYVQKFMEKREGQTRWLDVGAGSGETVAVLKEMGVEAAGLELSHASCAFAKEQYSLTLIRKTLAAFAQEENGKYDAISFFGVLEHLSDPMEALSISKRLLRPRGLLIAQVPNFDSFSTRVQSAFPKSVIRHAEPIGHMMLFTVDSLTRALNLHGFTPRALWYFGMDVHELIFHLALRDPSFASHELRHQLYDNLNLLQGIIDRAKLSDEILMVGKNES